MITYRFPPANFRLEYDPATGEAITRYPDGRWSGCGPVPEDAPHAAALGIEPADHRQAHELAHHLVGIYALDEASSPVVYRDAYHEPQPDPDPAHEEWLVTALTYFTYGEPCDYGALHHLKNKADVEPVFLKELLLWLLEAPDGVEVTVP